MRKITYIAAIWSLCLFTANALPTYYGLSGLTFVPSARISETDIASLAFRSVPATAEDMTIHPLSFSASAKIFSFMEVGVTNTYQYYLQSDMLILGYPITGGGFVADRSDIYFPVIPSVKFSFTDSAVPNGSIAVGLQYPLGAFFCFDYIIPFPADYALYLVFGFGTTFATLNPFMGLQMDFPFGLTLMLEGGYSGRTESLTAAQEMFGAATASYSIARSMDVAFTFRADRDGSRRAMISYLVDVEE